MGTRREFLFSKFIVSTLTRNLRLSIHNNDKNKPIVKLIPPSENETVLLDLKKSFGWYDFTILVKGFDSFAKRYAGRVDTGKESYSDPFMGKVKV